MDQVLHAYDAVLSQVLLNQLVVGQRDALLIDLAVTALVYQFANRLEVRVSICNKGFNNLEHFHGSLGETDEDTIVDLEETKELESLALLGIDFVDTFDTDDEDEFRLSRYKVLAILLSQALQTDLFSFGVTVFFDISLSALENNGTLFFVGL